jgi:hypothetical protein
MEEYPIEKKGWFSSDMVLELMYQTRAATVYEGFPTLQLIAHSRQCELAQLLISLKRKLLVDLIETKKAL